MRTQSGFQRYHHTSRKTDKLFETCAKFVRARELAYMSVATKNQRQMEAISALKKMLDFYCFAPHSELCQVILRYEKHLRTLIPSQYSSRHANAQKAVDGMINYANQYLNQ